MAENKKSVLLYCDLIHTVNALTDDEAGKLFKHYLAYINDLNPEPPDRLTQITFEPIKQTLKRDLLKWEEKKGTKSDSGILGNLKRWHPDLYQQVIDNELTLEESQNIAKHRKTSQEVANIAVSVKDKVIVKDIVKDKVINNNIKERKLKFASELEPYLELYGREMLNAFYAYWTEPNKTNTKFRQELEKTWSLERRLSTWNDRQKITPNNIQHEKFTKQQSKLRGLEELGNAVRQHLNRSRDTEG